MESKKLDVHLSIVVAARNDNYGGDFIHRFQCFVYHLNTQWSFLPKNCELIIVDWNSLEDEPTLEQSLSFLEMSDNVQIRIIKVPPSIHKSYQNHQKFGLYEYIAKNVGIRRAKGEFILATNPDIIFSDQLLNFLSFTNLKKDSFYRTDRIDYNGDIDYSQLISQNFCSIENSITGKFSYLRREFRDRIIENDRAYPHASGDFWLAHRNIWQELNGYREFTTSSHMDAILCFEAIKKGFSQIVLPSRMNIFHKDHSREDRRSRPGTNLNEWEQLCQKDDLKNNQSNWGLTNNDFIEIEI